MSIQDIAYVINSYFMKVAILVLAVLCPNTVLGALSGVALAGCFIAEQLTYETKAVGKMAYWADKVAIMSAVLFLAIGFMI